MRRPAAQERVHVHQGEAQVFLNLKRIRRAASTGVLRRLRLPPHRWREPRQRDGLHRRYGGKLGRPQRVPAEHGAVDFGRIGVGSAPKRCAVLRKESSRRVVDGTRAAQRYRRTGAHERAAVGANGEPCSPGRLGGHEPWRGGLTSPISSVRPTVPGRCSLRGGAACRHDRIDVGDGRRRYEGRRDGGDGRAHATHLVARSR